MIIIVILLKFDCLWNVKNCYIYYVLDSDNYSYFVKNCYIYCVLDNEKYMIHIKITVLKQTIIILLIIYSKYLINTKYFL